jgi:dihydroorotase
MLADWLSAGGLHDGTIPGMRAPQPQTLTLTRPDDWHLHLRDGAALRAVLPYTARQFGRAIVMPNLKPPVTTAQAALDYHERILDALPPELSFTPLMTLYLTDETTRTEILRAKAAGVVALKLYPAGATTNSDAGVTDIRKVLWHAGRDAAPRPAAAGARRGDRPRRRHLRPRGGLHRPRDEAAAARLPELKVVFEHITTQDAADYVAAGEAPRPPPSPRTTCCSTATHCSRAACARTTTACRCSRKNVHRQALVKAATSGSERFFLGTDSAPHAAALKEQSVCGAGCFTAPAALELYAEAFDAADALDKLEAFASHHGPAFYGLPRNSGTVTLSANPGSCPRACPSATR